MTDGSRKSDNDSEAQADNGTSPAAGSPRPPARSEAEVRRLRAAQKLRENLQRRKLQQRSRRAGLADDAEGLPAAQSPKDED